jgi:hypothetical protein
MPERGNLLGPNSFMELIPIRHNKILARKLQDTISLMVRDAGLIDGSALNHPRRLTKGAAAMGWPDDCVWRERHGTGSE